MYIFHEFARKNRSLSATKGALGYADCALKRCGAGEIEGNNMIEIKELGNREIGELLMRLNYGHLACCDESGPYVVPIHYAYEEPYIFVYTTEGKKSAILEKDPRICLQIEDVRDRRDWSSVIVFGEAERLVDEKERTKAIDAVVKINPTLTPAVSIRWLDNWVRENIEAVYRIIPTEMTGRASVAGSETRAAFAPRKQVG